MADEPSLPNFQAAATEATSSFPEPTRPETTNYSRSGPPDGGLVSNERFANEYNEAAQQHLQQRQPEPEKQALMEAAQALAPKENPNRDQQQEQQQQRGGREI